MADVDNSKVEPPKAPKPVDTGTDKTGVKDKGDGTSTLSDRVQKENSPADVRAANEADRTRLSTATLTPLEITDDKKGDAVKTGDAAVVPASEKPEDHHRRELNTREEQDKYWQERVDSVGVHTFRKTNGDYGITPVTAKDYPNGLTLSYTDGKIKMEQDVHLPDGGMIKAGQELPAGIRLYKDADAKWNMQLPQGNKIELGDDLKFSGGQQVAPGRVILSRPSIDERGQLCVDTYTQSPAEIAKFYHQDGALRVKLNSDVQTDRTMVPIDTKDPIVMKSYDGATMDHSGNAWLVKIPPNYGGGYYIVAEKDLMPLFDGTEPKAVAAKKQFDDDVAKKVAEENTAKATNVDYVKKSEQIALPLDAKEYMKVQPVEGEFVTQPTAWANRYGVKDGVVPVDIAMPGALKIYETPGVKSDWYVASAQFAAKNYKEVAPGQFVKTTPFMAEQLSKPDTANGFSGDKGDYLVTPLDGKGKPLFDKQYIVEKEKFEHLNAPREQVENAIQHGVKPLSISEAAAVQPAGPNSPEVKAAETPVQPIEEQKKLVRTAEAPPADGDNGVFHPRKGFKSSEAAEQPYLPGFEHHALPPQAVLEAMSRKPNERTPGENETVHEYLKSLGKSPEEARLAEAKVNEAVSKGASVAIALSAVLGLASQALAAPAAEKGKVTFGH